MDNEMKLSLMKARVECVYDELVPLGELKPHPKNPNKHPRKQLELMGKAIFGDGAEKGNGWRVPITVSKLSGYIVRGEGRFLTAQLMGEKYVPVDFQDYESEAHELADLIADNKLSDLAEMDTKAELALLAELDTGEIDLEITGFSNRELEALFNESREEEDKVLYPITAKLHEKYDYCLIFCENETDWLFLQQVMGLRREKSYKSKAVGTGRAIPFSRFAEKLKEYKDGVQPQEVVNENSDSVDVESNDNDDTQVVG
jgi:hypothetical protein